MKKRFFYFISIVSTFLIVGLLTTCKQEYSYEGGIPALYNFVGSPNACTDVVVSGKYVAGIPVADSANEIQLHINVTQRGTLTIATDKVDGIYFSGSASFTDTCSGCGITLMCHGTPDSAGTFIFHLPDTTGCYFSVTVSNKPSAEFTLSGAPDDCSNPVVKGSYNVGVPMTSGNVVPINVDVTTPGAYTIVTNVVNGISFSASGTFTTPGAQQVILQAIGKPEAADTSRFLLNAGASQCAFNVTIDNAEPVATYVLQSGLHAWHLYRWHTTYGGEYVNRKCVCNRCGKLYDINSPTGWNPVYAYRHFHGYRCAGCSTAGKWNADSSRHL